MPGRSETPEVELEGLIPAAKQLAERLRAAIHTAKDLRRAAVELESSSKTAAAPSQAGFDRVPQEAAELRAKAREAQEAACKQLGELLQLKSRIEICLLGSDDRARAVREALEKLSFATATPASNRWPPAASFEEDGVLRALDTFERLIEMIPISDRPGVRGIGLAGTLKNGQFCDQVIDEVQKIRHLYLADTMVQIRSDHPNFLVWSIIEHPDTDTEDRDIFHHPNQWGPVVGYALKLLARHFGKSEETIRRWRKAYRRNKTRSAVAPA